MMENGVDSHVRRFVQCVKEAEDPRKLQAILALVPKDDFMAWTDEYGQDALHYAIISGNAEAVDFLLKLGYFASPFEPEVNMYAHLAARLGFRAVLTTILKHRPADFKVANQPLFIPPNFQLRGNGFGKCQQLTKEPEVIMPAVVGSPIASRDARSSAMSPPFPPGSSQRFSLTPGERRASFAEPLLVHGRRMSRVVDQGDSSGPASQRRPSTIRRESDSADLGRLSIGSEYHGHKGQFPPHRLSGTTDSRGQSRRGSDNPLGQCKSLPRRESLPKTTRYLLERRRNSSPEDSLYKQNDVMVFQGSGKLKPLHCTPLEVAARSKHVDCVKTLLNMYVLQAYPDLGSKGYLTLAALANDAASIKLLIQAPHSGTNVSVVASKNREDFRRAVEICVRNVFPDCLAVLLAEELVDPRTIFRLANFYHEIYSIPCTTYKRLVSVTRLPAMTEMLIRRGHDVKAHAQPRTYPLYSLLDNAFTCNEAGFFESFLTCARMLLENGADPNFDEVKFEQQSQGMKLVSSERAPFSSALLGMMQCVERYRKLYASMTNIIHLVQSCIHLLISFNADIDQVGRLEPASVESPVYGDVLFQLASSSVTLRLDRGLVRCVIRFGARPDRKINGQFALNLYLDRLCSVNNSTVENVFETHQRELNMFIDMMCYYMAPWHIRDVIDIFKQKHHKCSGEQHKEFAEKVVEKLEREKQQIHPLRAVSAWKVWKLCHRKADNIKKLPISHEFKQNVLPLLLFQALW